jgi:hypothetical protein
MYVLENRAKGCTRLGNDRVLHKGGDSKADTRWMLTHDVPSVVRQEQEAL